MSAETEFARAMSLLSSGRRKEASAIFAALYDRATQHGAKIQLIEALLSALNPLGENQRLVDLASQGIQLASESRLPDIEAHFMARKADLMMNGVSGFQYRRKNLKLAPGWVGFSTEADKRTYEELTKSIDGIEKDIDGLLHDALSLAQRSGSKKALAFIFMSKASIESARYLKYKMECVRGTMKSKIRLLLHRLGYDVPILNGYRHYRNCRSHIESFTEYYLTAAKLFEELGDDGASFAYYNLAVHLKSAYRFRQARGYLMKAKVLAEKQGNALLLAKISELQKSIRSRNRDTPNYLGGETRADVTV